MSSHQPYEQVTIPIEDIQKYIGLKVDFHAPGKYTLEELMYLWEHPEIPLPEDFFETVREIVNESNQDFKKRKLREE